MARPKEGAAAQKDTQAQMQTHWGGYSAQGDSISPPCCMPYSFMPPIPVSRVEFPAAKGMHRQTMCIQIPPAAPARLSQGLCISELWHQGCSPGSYSESIDCSLQFHKQCCKMQAVDAARRFNASWDSDIQLLRHDCHHHTAELVRVLTGEDMDVWKLFPLQQTTIWM